MTDIALLDACTRYVKAYGLWRCIEGGKPHIIGKFQPPRVCVSRETVQDIRDVYAKAVSRWSTRCMLEGAFGPRHLYTTPKSTP